jgi:Kef-type K+ transport system membrane component KefB
MFLVGLRLDLREVSAFRHVAGLAGLLSIAVPFLAGLLLARPLHVLAPQSPMLPFSLFIAVSMSITAFPVLARILSDQGLTETRLGHVAIACAALNDVIAWILLAWITALTRAAGGHVSIFGTVAIVGAYGLIMACVVRPLLRLLTGRFPVMNELPVLLVIAFLSSWVTEWMGIHALFGAFFAGVIWPRGEAEGSASVEEISGKLEPIAMMVLVPLFFSYTGIRTNIGLIGGAAGAWGYFAVIVVVAIAGKVGGAFLGGTIMRFGVRDSLALGALLNTRGLVELIALNVGLDLGILSPSLFSTMVLMALTTTLMTVPLLRCILPGPVGRAMEPSVLRRTG